MSALTGLLCTSAPSAEAQRASDNAVTGAEDAFGYSVGIERIGLYSPSEVRGFSPSTAGNIRIEGLYFDNRTPLSSRLVSGSIIRVGPSALSYPFPAPTGIVDYHLRTAVPQRVISVVGGLAEYAAPFVEVDTQFPLKKKLRLTAGVSAAHDEYFDGTDAFYMRYALMPQWQPSEKVEVIPFWSTTHGTGEEVVQTFVTEGNYSPPPVKRRVYFGQPWAQKINLNHNGGVLARAKIGESFGVQAGLFHSRATSVHNYADVYQIHSTGLASELLTPDPPQKNASWSGEARGTWSHVEGPRLHQLQAIFRGRRQSNRYSGSAATLDLGERKFGEQLVAPKPTRFDFAPRTKDGLSQWFAGVGYEGRWKDKGVVTFGVQRTDYQKNIERSLSGPIQNKDDLFLYNGSIALTMLPRTLLYASYTRGIEESGVAPDGTRNRLEVLPPIRTSQRDAGVRVTLRPKLSLVAGWFDVRKPYLSTDQTNLYTQLGTVRHQGLEASLSGTMASHLTVVAGAVLLNPVVSGEAVALGTVGPRAIGKEKIVARFNADYQIPKSHGLSANLGYSYYGDRVASRANRLLLPSYSLLDVGARYAFHIGKSQGSLRFAASNLMDTYYYDVLSANTFVLTDGRRATGYIAIDF